MVPELLGGRIFGFRFSRSVFCSGVTFWGSIFSSFGCSVCRGIGGSVSGGSVAISIAIGGGCVGVATGASHDEHGHAANCQQTHQLFHLCPFSRKQPVVFILATQAGRCPSHRGSVINWDATRRAIIPQIQKIC